MAVLVERHRRRLVPQHLLHHLDVRTAGDRQARCCVAQFVRRDPRNPSLLAGLVERAALENKRGNIFLWPAKLPTIDGNRGAQAWYRSALEAADKAKHHWVKIIGNRDLGAYEIILARGNLGNPQWPDHSFEDLIKLAFHDNLIKDIDHPVIKDLNGEI